MNWWEAEGEIRLLNLSPRVNFPRIVRLTGSSSLKYLPFYYLTASIIEEETSRILEEYEREKKENCDPSEALEIATKKTFEERTREGIWIARAHPHPSREQSAPLFSADLFKFAGFELRSRFWMFPAGRYVRRGEELSSLESSGFVTSEYDFLCDQVIANAEIPSVFPELLTVQVYASPFRS